MKVYIKHICAYKYILYVRVYLMCRESSVLSFINSETEEDITLVFGSTDERRKIY